jgi:hypothetical protein
MFRRLARHSGAGDPARRVATAPTHVITSEFSAARCRFVLECSCGVSFDTNYIDEALEWRELHTTLAPLEDQLAASDR